MMGDQPVEVVGDGPDVFGDAPFIVVQDANEPFGGRRDVVQRLEGNAVGQCAIAKYRHDVLIAATLIAPGADAQGGG